MSLRLPELSLRLPEHCPAKFVFAAAHDTTPDLYFLCFKLAGHKSDEHISVDGHRWKDSDGQR